MLPRAGQLLSGLVAELFGRGEPDQESRIVVAAVKQLTSRMGRDARLAATRGYVRNHPRFRGRDLANDVTQHLSLVWMQAVMRLDGRRSCFRHHKRQCTHR